MKKNIIAALSMVIATLAMFPAYGYVRHRIHHAVTTTTTTVTTTTPTTKIATSYVQWGKRYGVLATSKNYNEVGLASWYGTAFQHHYTSSGVRYNMYSMTAASKTLPLNTYVQVTNLNNGRQVVVKVNDRGPFVSGRIIDLSYAAAKKLGMVNQGVARVDVKAI